MRATNSSYSWYHLCIRWQYAACPNVETFSQTLCSDVVSFYRPFLGNLLATQFKYSHTRNDSLQKYQPRKRYRNYCKYRFLLFLLPVLWSPFFGHYTLLCMNDIVVECWIRVEFGGNWIHSERVFSRWPLLRSRRIYRAKNWRGNCRRNRSNHIIDHYNSIAVSHTSRFLHFYCFKSSVGMRRGEKNAWYYANIFVNLWNACGTSSMFIVGFGTYMSDGCVYSLGTAEWAC